MLSTHCKLEVLELNIKFKNKKMKIYIDLKS